MKLNSQTINDSNLSKVSSVARHDANKRNQIKIKIDLN